MKFRGKTDNIYTVWSDSFENYKKYYENIFFSLYIYK